VDWRSHDGYEVPEVGEEGGGRGNLVTRQVVWDALGDVKLRGRRKNLGHHPKQRRRESRQRRRLVVVSQELLEQRPPLVLYALVQISDLRDVTCVKINYRLNSKPALTCRTINNITLSFFWISRRKLPLSNNSPRHAHIIFPASFTLPFISATVT
jgi:hypothetical protein